MTRWLVAAGTALTLLGCGTALAAEAPADPGITVQLDGQALAFTDAVPQVKDQRTFLPFRAVFEAMGAEVSNEGSVITAVRGDKILTMTLGEQTAVVTENGKETTLEMDVAPYVDNTTWRTYVPVRFAAQAFDCAVGWDQEAMTAIIVDADKVVDQALEGKKFTYLEKLVAYSEKYNEGIWDMQADFAAELSMMAMPMSMEGSVTGTTADGEKVEMDMNMKMDLTEFIKSIELLAGTGAELTEEEQAMLDALKTEGIDLSMRGDVAQGKLYMNMKGDIMTAAGMDTDTWYEMDLAAILAESGLDWAELMETSKQVDYVALAKSTVSAMALTDAATAYDEVKAVVEEVVTALSDEGFVKDEDTYTAVVAVEEDGSIVTVVLTMTMKGDEVTAYVMGISLEVEEDGMVMSMDMTTSVDDKDQMTAEMNMDMAGLFTMNMTLNGGYTQGKTAPATEPPAGASVTDWAELVGSTGDVGAIGGADGPTEVFVTGPNA